MYCKFLGLLVPHHGFVHQIHFQANSWSLVLTKYHDQIMDHVLCIPVVILEDRHVDHGRSYTQPS